MRSYSLDVVEFQPSDPRLGRHVRHDSRSLAFQVEPAQAETLKSVRHEFVIPILNQGQVGSCTGNSSTYILGSKYFTDSDPELLKVLSKTDTNRNQVFAIGVYSDATKLDPFAGVYQPDDTGSDGLSVAKVLKQRGRISGYQHATSLAALQTALAKHPVIVGTRWKSGMFEPTSSGQLRVEGDNAGGHEYCLDELDMERQRVWVRNSWGDRWGQSGRAWLTFADMARLLADRGDCTVFVPNTAPAPEPKPELVDPNLAKLKRAHRLMREVMADMQS